LAGKYGKIPSNNWSSAAEEERLWWNMASCDVCSKLRRFPPHFEQFFPSDKEYEFCCDWNVWDNFNSCEAAVEDGCEADDPDEVTFSAADLTRIQEARDEAERGVQQPKAKKARKKKMVAVNDDAQTSSTSKKRGRPRKDEDTTSSDYDEEQEDEATPRKLMAEEIGPVVQSVHPMSMRTR